MAERVVTLNNGALIRLLKNPKIIKKFPKLRGPARTLNQVRGCKCSRRRANQQTRALNDFKTMIRSWPAGEKQQLKKLLNADKLRVFVAKKMVEF